MNNEPDAKAPLRGVRVVDLSTMQADQGADVVKVEAPEADTSRRIGPAKGDLSAMFVAADRAVLRGAGGQHVQVSMRDAAVAFQWPDAMYNPVFLDEVPPPAPEFGIRHRPWKTRDGALTTNTPQRSELVGLVTALGRPELADDPRVSGVPGLQRPGQALRDELGPVLADLSTDEAVRRPMAHGVPVGRVNGRVRLPAGAARFADGAPRPPGPGAHRGQHTREVLAELDHDAQAIDALLAAGAAR